VKQIFPAKQAAHRSGRVEKRLAWSLEILLGLAVWVVASFASAQATPAPSRAPQKKDKTEVAEPVQKPAPALRVPLILGDQVEEQNLTQPPDVSWDGKLLTVDTENSTLNEILLAVRAQTGATVEIPPSASTEHVALHIGPAPVRDVISTLLYGTNYDYVIQAADDDPDGLRAVIVTLRGKGEDMLSADTTVTVPSGPGVRMMKGYAAPGKPAFQADAEAALSDSPAIDTPAPTDSASATPPAGSDQAAPAATDAAAANTADPSTTPATSADADSSPSVDSMPLTSRTSTAALTASEPVGDPSSMSHMVQDLQRMYQQRQQIQAQQNQAKQSSTN